MRGAWNVRRPAIDDLLLAGMLAVLAAAVVGGVVLLVAELRELLSVGSFSRGGGA